MQDGWSNIHNDPVIASSVHINSTRYILDTRDCGSDKKNSDFCTEIARKTLNIV
jgi:hypothetical protein